MRAAKPTTRPPLSFQQFGPHSLDVLAPRFYFLGPEHPADPLIAGKRGEVFPRRQSLWAGNQDASQVYRDGMDHSARDHPGTHRSPIVAPMQTKAAWGRVTPWPPVTPRAKITAANVANPEFSVQKMLGTRDLNPGPPSRTVSVTCPRVSRRPLYGPSELKLPSPDVLACPTGAVRFREWATAVIRRGARGPLSPA
jgi:hypothetical protein